MLSLPGYDTSGFKSIPQSSSWTTKHVTFNFSPLRTSLDCERLCPTPVSRAKHNAALPINQIPIELLCDIFFKFLDDDREFPDYTSAVGPLVSFHSRADPTTLGQVCSWWRNVALSTPALWANIFILEPRNCQISRTRLWLERAGNYPLNLVIRELRRSGHYELVAIQKILTSFILRLEFWRKIDLVLPVDALQSLIIITHNSAQCQRLESASLNIWTEQLLEPSTRSSIDAVWRTLHSSPILHRVRWQDLYRGGDLPDHAPWCQITHISLGFEFGVETLLDVLSSCLKLEDLYVFKLSMPNRSERQTQFNPLVLENLHTLTLESTIETGPLFEQITLPSLCSLSIRHRCKPQGDVFPFVGAFNELLARSNCFLKKFSLFDCYLPEQHLNQCLSSPYLQSLISLDVKGLITDKIIKSLSRLNDNGCHEMMPSLKEICLGKCTTTDGLLANMINSRWSKQLAAGHMSLQQTLELVVLDTDGYGTTDDSHLTTMFDAGLKGWKD